MNVMKEYTAFDSDRRCAENDGVFCWNIPLAMAYVKNQNWEKPMNAGDALGSGTAFESLVMPFQGVCGR